MEERLEYQNPFFSIYSRDQLQDKQKSYYVIDPGQDSVIILPKVGARILFVSQWRPTIQSYTVELPGGGIEPNEMLIDAAVRELKEETGVEGNSFEHFFSYYPLVSRMPTHYHIFSCEVDEQDLNFNFNSPEISEVE